MWIFSSLGIDPPCGYLAEAQKWTQTLAKLGDTAICSPELGARMAGSLSFAVTVTCDRVGRAVVEPFYAQAKHRLLG